MKALPSFLQRADQEFFKLPYTIKKAQMLASNAISGFPQRADVIGVDGP